MVPKVGVSLGLRGLRAIPRPEISRNTLLIPGTLVAGNARLLVGIRRVKLQEFLGAIAVPLFRLILECRRADGGVWRGAALAFVPACEGSDIVFTALRERFGNVDRQIPAIHNQA